MLKKLLVVFCIVLCCSKFAFANTITLQWQANTDLPIGGYKVHRGTASGQYDNVIDVGDVTEYITVDLPQGKTYFFVLTAYRPTPDNNIESGYSDEASKRISYGTPNNPTGLKLILTTASANIDVYNNTGRVGFIPIKSVSLSPLGNKRYGLAAEFIEIYN